MDTSTDSLSGVLWIVKSSALPRWMVDSSVLAGIRVSLSLLLVFLDHSKAGKNEGKFRTLRKYDLMLSFRLNIPLFL
jgi:hypothetical protein